MVAIVDTNLVCTDGKNQEEKNQLYLTLGNKKNFRPLFKLFFNFFLHVHALINYEHNLDIFLLI